METERARTQWAAAAALQNAPVQSARDKRLQQALEIEAVLEIARDVAESTASTLGGTRSDTISKVSAVSDQRRVRRFRWTHYCSAKGSPDGRNEGNYTSTTELDDKQSAPSYEYGA